MLRKEDLIDGEIYVYDCDDNFPKGTNYIFKYLSSNNFTSVNGKSYTGIKVAINTASSILNKSIYTGWDLNLREATPEQKHWLNECIRLDKFVSYEEATKTFVEEFILPEKWCVKSNIERKEIIQKYAKQITNRKPLGDSAYYHFPDYHGCCSSGFIYPDYKEITFEQFKKYVLKEDELPYKIIKQENNNIIEVENEEGSLFRIGDTIKAVIRNHPSKITKFEFTNNNKILKAVTSNFPNGISIDKIEHYVEPKEEFKLPEIYCVHVNNNKEFHQVMTYFEDLQNGYFKQYHHRNYNISTKDYYIGFNIHNNLFYNKTHDKDYHGEIITFDQFKQYVLGEKPEVKIVEESLLDKAKRLYPIGTKFINPVRTHIESIVKNDNYFEGPNDNIYCAIDKNSHSQHREVEGVNGCLYYKGQWAEIIEPVDNSKYEILSFNSIQGITRKLNSGRFLTEHLNESDLPLLQVTSGDGMGATLEQMLDYMTESSNNYKIHSIKQLSTGEVFTIGDKVKINSNSYQQLHEVTTEIKKINLTENNNIQFELTYGTVLLQNCIKTN